MTPVLPGDISALARVLRGAAPARRKPLAEQIIAEAETAFDHVAATGRAHPAFGTGALMTAALTHKVMPEPFWDDPDYLHCLMTALEVLRAHLLQRDTQLAEAL